MLPAKARYSSPLPARPNSHWLRERVQAILAKLRVRGLGDHHHLWLARGTAPVPALPYTARRSLDLGLRAAILPDQYCWWAHYAATTRTHQCSDGPVTSR